MIERRAQKQYNLYTDNHTWKPFP